jgi:hypothetical protein
MYKRIYDSEEIVVDYYNDGKPMIRVSQFKDYHWQDEHFVELPEEFEPVVHAHWVEDDRCCSRSCSACGFEIHDDASYELYSDYRIKPKRCPECGAHTDEEVAE